MRRCPFLWTMLLLALAAAVPLAAADDPDLLFRQRDNLALAGRAADIWQHRLDASPRDFEAACKLARARHWIGERSQRDRARSYREGMAAARVAIAIEPGRPDGYFWLGVNTGGLATVSNPLLALRYRSDIRTSFEKSLAISPGFLFGGAHCALGKYYNAVPAFFGGNRRRSEQLLRQCLTYDTNNTAGHYYLAQTLVAIGRIPEARTELQATLDSRLDEEFAPESGVWKRRAARMLAKLDASR